MSAGGRAPPRQLAVKAKRPRLDTERAEQELWLLKVPQFVSLSWQSIELLQEKEALRRTDAAQELVAVTQTIVRRAPGVAQRRAARTRALFLRRQRAATPKPTHARARVRARPSFLAEKGALGPGTPLQGVDLPATLLCAPTAPRPPAATMTTLGSPAPPAAPAQSPARAAVCAHCRRLPRRYRRHLPAAAAPRFADCRRQLQAAGRIRSGLLSAGSPCAPAASRTPAAAHPPCCRRRRLRSMPQRRR